MGLLTPRKSLQEIEEETEHVEAENRRADMELSLAQKKEAISRLKERGLSPKHFPDWRSIMQWLRTH